MTPSGAADAVVGDVLPSLVVALVELGVADLLDELRSEQRQERGKRRWRYGRGDRRDSIDIKFARTSFFFEGFDLELLRATDPGGSYAGRMTESPSYWRSAAEDEAMQDAHGFVWKAMLDTIDVDLAGKRVLDAGCNRGGFLRLLSDACAIAEGRGYDPHRVRSTMPVVSPGGDPCASRSPTPCRPVGGASTSRSATRSST